MINVSNDTKSSNDAAADAASQRPETWPTAAVKEAPIAVVSADEGRGDGGEEGRARGARHCSLLTNACRFLFALGMRPTDEFVARCLA